MSDVLDPARYTVAWIAPLEIEARAALHLLDHRHRGRFPLARGDDYIFHAGDMCRHNIVIATLPAGQVYGTGSAAALASQVKKFFPNLWFGLLVGVAAGLPHPTGDPPRDIRLGDVLVALPEGDSAGLVAYDLGKETAGDGFQLLRFGHVLATTEVVVRSAIGSIKLEAPNDVDIFLPYYDAIKDKEHATGTFADPGQDRDTLYEFDDDGGAREVDRLRRPDARRTRVWYGPIGSGEKLMKNAQQRNELRDRYNVIGLEMEAAGTMDRIPVGVIRAVCDYGDPHKNKEWQPYAAAMAAAYAKAVLREILPSKSPTVGSPSTGKENCYIGSERIHFAKFTLKFNPHPQPSQSLLRIASNRWPFRKCRLAHTKLRAPSRGHASGYVDTRRIGPGLLAIKACSGSRESRALGSRHC
jgi:nucleoside phosphorylase